MNLRKISTLGAFCALMTGGSLAVYAQTAEEENVQVLTRGPVHEAFAESVSFDPEAGLVVSVRPPDAIEELPPEQQLEGDNVTWIPGYWAWDDDQNDFIWISGIWRNLPPGRQWVPGYWSGIDGGKYQWTSGYWKDATTDEVSYVSAPPPRNIDVGPNIAAPSDDANWVPGNWHWVESRYVWRPGYWLPLRTDWTWVPARYCWTRRGYVFVDGYWDYAVARRGVLFAPVCFRQRYYERPDYCYTPAIVVALDVFTSHLFVRPRCGHYYFGDYYAPRYRDAGFYASFSWHSGHHGYDPIYAYDRWDHRHDRHWERQRHDDFNYFRDHEDARPPRTWAVMRDYREDRFNDGRQRKYAASLSGFAKQNKSGQRFHALDEGGRKQLVSQRQEMRKFGQARREMESRAKAPGDASRKIAREKTARSPVIGRNPERLAKNDGPPKRPGDHAAKLDVKKPQQGIVRREERREPPKRQDTVTGRSRVEKPRDAGSEKPRREPTVGKPRITPQRAQQAMPPRKIDAAPRVRPKPERAVEYKPQARKVIEPRKQAVPKRQNLPDHRVRPAPPRKEQLVPRREVPSRPQVREAPQRKQQVAQRREARVSPAQANRPTQKENRKRDRDQEKSRR